MCESKAQVQMKKMCLHMLNFICMLPAQTNSNLWDILELCISIVIGLLLIENGNKCSLFLFSVKGKYQWFFTGRQHKQ